MAGNQLFIRLDLSNGKQIGSWFVKSTARCASQLSRPRPAAEPN
jgi:hypothetical protein